MGEGGSEEEADERFMVRFDLNPFVTDQIDSFRSEMLVYL